MKQKNTGNIFIDDPNGALTFGKIFTVLRYSLVRIVVYLLVACIIAGCVCIGLSLTTPKTRTATTVLRFDYEGISAGLTPDGDEFNIEGMKDANILNDAIAELGKEDERLTANALHSNLHIDAVIPSDILAKMKDLENEDNKDPNKSAKLEALEYHPSEFYIHLDNYASMGLSDNEAKTLLDNIVSIYKEKWITTFVDNVVLNTTIIENIKDNGVGTNDYLQYEYLLEKELDTIEKYLAKNSNIDFTFEGRTFSSLLNDVRYIRNSSFSTYTSYVKENKVTINPALVESTIKHQITSLTVKNNVLKSEIISLTNAIKEMKPNSDKTQIGNNIQTSTTYPYTYWKLQLDLTELIKEQTEVEECLEMAKANQTAMSGATESSEEVKTAANNYLKAAATELLEVANNTMALASNFKKNASLDNGIDNAVPTYISEVGGVKKMAILLTFAVPVFVAIIAAFAVTYRCQKKFAFTRLHGNDNANDNDDMPLCQDEVADDENAND